MTDAPFVDKFRQMESKFVAASLAPPTLSHLARQGEDQSMRALAALAALGQPTRLAVFRLLVRHEPDGLAAGAVAAAVGGPHNTLSTHLAILARAGLVRATRDGRSIVYRADLAGMRQLVAFLLADCCDGRPEVCGPIGDLLAGCRCSPNADADGPADVTAGCG
jgi:ArsR family transcriptional regulator